MRALTMIASLQSEDNRAVSAATDAGDSRADRP